MSTQALDPSLLQDARDAQSYAFSTLAAFTWICYDILIAFDREVAHIWQAKWSAAKVLYLLARYVTVIALFFYWLTGAAQELPDSLCRAWPIASGIFMVIIGVSVDLIQLLRVRAIFKSNRKVTFPLYLFFAGVFLAAIVVIATRNSNSDTIEKTVYVIGCFDNSDNTSTLAAWIAEMALGGVFFFLTIWKLYPYLWRKNMHTPFLTAIVQGGVLFYAIIFAAELFNTIFAQLMSEASRPNLMDIGDPWALAVYGIAGPRLVLHLRGVMTNFVDLDDATQVVRLTEERALVAARSDLLSNGAETTASQFFA